MGEFYTFSNIATWEQIIDKSRFIAVGMPLLTLEEIDETMSKIRQDYPNARHYVYAYRLRAGRVEKSSDDGEPQGTGGRPLLDLLQHKNVWNILLVVVRYFGGILLGTGGLVRAYGGTARQVVADTNLKKLALYKLYSLFVPYEWYENLKYQLVQHNWGIQTEEFQEVVKLLVYVPELNAGEFIKWVDDFTRRQVTWEDKGNVLM